MGLARILAENMPPGNTRATKREYPVYKKSHKAGMVTLCFLPLDMEVAARTRHEHMHLSQHTAQSGSGAAAYALVRRLELVWRLSWLRCPVRCPERVWRSATVAC